LYIIRVDSDKWVRCNGHKLFRLTRPFRFYANKRRASCSISQMIKKPSDTFNSNRTLVYSVVINDVYVGRLYPRWSRGFKCHSIYGLEKLGSYNSMGGHRLFKSKALEHIMSELSNEDSTYQEIREYLFKVLLRLYESYNFDCVFTDSYPLAKFLNTYRYPTPVVRSSWSMIKVPSGLGKDLTNVIKRILATHGSIPLVFLDYRVLKALKFTDITIQNTFRKAVVSNLFTSYSNYMFITVQNHFFAGYIGRVLTNIFKRKEVLPLTLFSV